MITVSIFIFFFLVFCFMQVEHKIQSCSSLVLKMDQVPKMLKLLAEDWAPDAFIVSFKVNAKLDRATKLTNHR